MSNIDLKRLAEDREYWDQCGAPEGTTHYQIGSEWPWEKVTKQDHYYWQDKTWYSLGRICLDEKTIPRPPQKEQEVESLGGWRTGDIVQTGPNSLRYKVEWAKGEDVLISEIGRPYEVNLTKWDMIIPGRTKEQRLRDELAELIGEHQELSGSFVTPENTADAIFSRYNLEPKP